MININKIILTAILSLGTLTMALAQSHSRGSVVARDTVIYVTPEQLEEGVRSVAQAIVDSRKAQKVETSKDILTKENIQLLKYQMLISALGMNLGPAPAQQVQQIPANVGNNNSNVDARLDRLENMLYQFLQNQETNHSRTTIATPFIDSNRSGKTTILSKRKGKKDLTLSLSDKACKDCEKDNENCCSSDKSCEKDNKDCCSSLDKGYNNSCIESSTSSNGVKSYCIELDSLTSSNITSMGINYGENIPEIVTDTLTVTVIEPILADFKRQVFFSLGEDVLTPDAEATLDNVVSVLNQYPNLSLSIIGYASVDGNRDFNLRLSARRTSKVFGYIVSKGISPNRMYVENGGIDTNASIISTARRVDIVAVNNLVE